jgi:hypothetical protein
MKRRVACRGRLLWTAQTITQHQRMRMRRRQGSTQRKTCQQSLAGKKPDQDDGEAVVMASNAVHSVLLKHVSQKWKPVLRQKTCVHGIHVSQKWKPVLRQKTCVHGIHVSQKWKPVFRERIANGGWRIGNWAIGNGQ